MRRKPQKPLFLLALISGTSFRQLLDWVTVRINFVHFADVQFADTRFHFAHIPHYHPNEMARLDVLIGDLVGRPPKALMEVRWVGKETMAKVSFSSMTTLSAWTKSGNMCHELVGAGSSLHPMRRIGEASLRPSK